MGLESVGDFALPIILTKLSPEGIARVACVSKRFRSSVSEDSLWFRVCSQELCVTNPVDLLGNPVPSFKVRASAVFIPELADLLDHREMYLFFYSIRMSLQPQGCIINGMFFNSCQLHQRHWLIPANDVIVSDVNGEAVIGERLNSRCRCSLTDKHLAIGS